MAAPHDRSVLRVHARWILTLGLVAVASACLLAWALQPPVYRSEARVLVSPGATPGGAPLPPDMETERQVVVSGAVTSDAAQRVGTSSGALKQRLTVTVPANSTILVIDYSDATATEATRRAQAVVDSYVAYRAPQAAVLDAASTPRSATGPNYLLDAAAALVIGLLLGVGSALLRDRLDDRVRGPGDLVERADVPVLTTVPVTVAGAGGDSSDLVILNAPDSPAAEAYRQLRGKVTRAARGSERTTLILVTSAAEDDGAAEVAANTAAALALLGGKVLLVEANLRTPRLDGLFDLPGDTGLGNVLAESAALTEALRDTGIDGLRLLPAGAGRPAAPGELFDEQAVDKLLSQFAAEVDWVIVLAPPVLGAAETSTLAEHAGLVLFVVAPKRTSRRDLEAALAELRDAGAPILGGVLCVPVERRLGTQRQHDDFGAPRSPRSAGADGPRPERDAPARVQAVPARPEDGDRIAPGDRLVPPGSTVHADSDGRRSTDAERAR